MMNEISKSRVDQLIPKAIEIIKNIKIATQEENQWVTPKEFHGYISSFGADMVMTSPLASAIFYEDSSGSDEDRSKLPKAILHLMRSEKGADKISEEHLKLSSYLMEFGGRVPNNIVQDVLTASVAIKMGLKTFKKVKTSKHE